ncbi:GTPase HflX [Ligilactobacillus agilis]|uniref:GTPase HflX n=1 Tax=Ligilactobacillus agilis TaxID=1601 RepID=UPI00195E9EB1|nr:GTPase HflX [Ligilactobacillus agilis]MBM6763239.1 GTPase HflX [Ligilactobacillus agilis]
MNTIIAGIENNQANFDYTMEELAALASADNLTVVKEIRQKLDQPVAATYFGKGKAEEIKTASEIYDAQLLVVNDELTPTQIRNLEAITDLTILDRTALILEIFASRARTKEAKLQVQIAKLQYQLPRLQTGKKDQLDQQTAGNAGGGYTNRGAGETKLELNRRVIQKRISNLRKELKELTKNHEVQRQQRQKNQLKTVALVGYTNAGKSTTMNQILALTGAKQSKQVFEKDMLFATLDTAVRKISLEDKKEFLLSDTVGFVSKLPHQLVKSFRATLEEAAQADLLIQVIDGADEHAKEMIATTEATLKEIGVTDIPMIYAYNKADKSQLAYPVAEGNQITYSARQVESIELLLELIKKELFKDYEEHTYLIPYDQGRYLDLLNQQASISKQDYLEAGYLVKAEVAPKLAGQLAQFLSE